MPAKAGPDKVEALARKIRERVEFVDISYGKLLIYARTLGLGGKPQDRVGEARDSLAMRLVDEGITEAPENTTDLLQQELDKMREKEKGSGGRPR